LSQDTQTSTILTWSDELRTGLDIVDEQHIQLIAIFNKLVSTQAQDTAAGEVVQALVCELNAYTRYHFEMEADLMCKWPVEVSHRVKHLRAHQSFIKFLERADTLAASNPFDVANHLLAFLAQWLLHHIMGVDARMARQIIALQSGATLPCEGGKTQTMQDLLIDSVSSLNDSLGQRTFEILDLNRQLQEEREKLRHQATYDALTGLPNRTLFHEILNRAITHAARQKTMIAVLFLDLDGFKNINDALGHGYGDLLLQETAKRLTAMHRQEDWVARGEDVIARQGGDEFTILLQDVTSVYAITEIAERLLAAVARPYIVGGHEMHITGSLGITVYPSDDTNSENLLRNADLAMYRAKYVGKNTFQFYAASMSAQITEHRIIENGLHHALENGELLLHYQPQVDLHNGRLAGIEALIRWQHPERGLIAPDQFMPVAEQSGLIVAIGEWVLRAACVQGRAWQKQGLLVPRISVNLSGRQLKAPDLPETIAQILKDTGFDTGANILELEVTESMLMEDMERTAQTLQAFHAMGLRLAIDDFGVGYSSLNYLKRFPISTLKIDRSFVRDLVGNSDDAAIATVIITLGHSLGLTVIAEGVETLEQAAFLRQARCDEIQGYHYSKPLSADGMTQWLQDDCFTYA